jgi:HSP20 family protein
MNTLFVRRNIDPYATAASVNRAMDRMVRDAFGTTWGRSATQPAIDVSETDTAYVIKAALPGWAPEQIEVTFEEGVVTLKGEVTPEPEGDAAEAAPEPVAEKVHIREIVHESFVRRLSLPVEVDADKAVAEHAHGVLTLTLPKAEVVKPKQIKIAVK